MKEYIDFAFIKEDSFPDYSYQRRISTVNKIIIIIKSLAKQRVDKLRYNCQRVSNGYRFWKDIIMILKIVILHDKVAS